MHRALKVLDSHVSSPANIPSESKDLAACQLPSLPNDIYFLTHLQKLSDFVASSNCFGISYGSEAAYLALFILRLPLNLALYEYSDGKAFIRLLRSAFNQLIFKSSLGPNIPFGDHLLALYKIYLLVCKIGVALEGKKRDGPARLASLCLPQAILNYLDERILILPYSDSLSDHLVGLKIELSHCKSQSKELIFGLDKNHVNKLSHGFVYTDARTNSISMWGYAFSSSFRNYLNESITWFLTYTRSFLEAIVIF